MDLVIHFTINVGTFALGHINLVKPWNVEEDSIH